MADEEATSIITTKLLAITNHQDVLLRQDQAQTRETTKMSHVHRTDQASQQTDQVRLQTDRQSQLPDRISQQQDRVSRLTDHQRRTRIILLRTATVSHVQVQNTLGHSETTTQPRDLTAARPQGLATAAQPEATPALQEAQAASTQAHAA